MQTMQPRLYLGHQAYQIIPLGPDVGPGMAYLEIKTIWNCIHGPFILPDKHQCLLWEILQHQPEDHPYQPFVTQELGAKP